MIFAEFNNFLCKVDPRKRVHITWPKISNRVRKRVWLYLYTFFILGAPFTRTSEVIAPVIPKQVEAKVDTRVIRLKSFFERYDSPLAPHAEKFIDVSDRYGFDWRFLPAIAGTESTLGLSVPRGSYNPFGWANGRCRFASWDQAIETVGKALYEKYYLKGKRPLTVEQVGKIYAVSPHWPKSVRLWMGRISTRRFAVAK